jgi:hypothetical protein
VDNSKKYELEHPLASSGITVVAGGLNNHEMKNMDILFEDVYLQFQ